VVNPKSQNTPVAQFRVKAHALPKTTRTPTLNEPHGTHKNTSTTQETQTQMTHNGMMNGSTQPPPAYISNDQ